MKTKRVLQMLFFVTVVLLIIVYLLWFSPVRYIAAIGMEYLFAKWEIDNPYVDSGYPGWQYVYIEECGGFLIPEGWSIVEADGVYSVLDSSGEVWAYGADVGTESNRFRSYKELVSEISPIQPTSLAFEYSFPFVMMEGSEMNRLTINSETESEEYYCIHLFMSTDSQFVLLLSEDLTVDETQFNIAEALVYSYAFDVEK